MHRSRPAVVDTMPVRVKKTREIKNLELLFQSEPVMPLRGGSSPNAVIAAAIDG
jgi:hypothetical protein